MIFWKSSKQPLTQPPTPHLRRKKTKIFGDVCALWICFTVKYILNIKEIFKYNFLGIGIKLVYMKTTIVQSCPSISTDLATNIISSTCLIPKSFSMNKPEPFCQIRPSSKMSHSLTGELSLRRMDPLKPSQSYSWCCWLAEFNFPWPHLL